MCHGTKSPRDSITPKRIEPRDTPTSFTTSTLSTDRLVDESTHLPSATRPKKPHTSVVDALFSAHLASNPAASRYSPLSASGLTQTVSSIANLSSALLVHPSYGRDAAADTLHHAMQHVMTADYFSDSQAPEITDQLILTTSRSFALEGERSGAGELAWQLGVSAAMSAAVKGVEAGGACAGCQRILGKMLRTISGEQEGVLAKR